MAIDWCPQPTGKTPAYVSAKRRDGKYTVTMVFSSGRRIGKLVTQQQLDAMVADDRYLMMRAH